MYAPLSLWPGNKILQIDLHNLDANLREEVACITSLKNDHTKHILTTLRTISSLNTALIALPPALADLQARLRAKTSFSHIARLHGMLYAYGATVVEIVRRKEFGECCIGRWGN